MKKTLFFIALAALCPNVFAQDYIPVLEEGGLLVINEYVGPNRMQYPKDQLIEI